MDEGINDPAYVDQAQLMGIPSDNRPFREIRPLLEQALESGGWIVLAGHEIGEDNTPQTTRVSFLKELFAYVHDPKHPIWLDTLASVSHYVREQHTQASPRLLYRDASLPIPVRVEDLLKRMTLEEKVGQMNMPCVYEDKLGKETAGKLEACKKFVSGEYEIGFGPGGGFFTLANTILPNGPRQQAEYFNQLQQIALKTRLGIPLLQTEEGTHGLMCSGSTIFPEGLAIRQQLEHGSRSEDLYRCGPGSSHTRHPSAFHPGRGAQPGSTPGQESGRIWRGPLPGLTNRRNNC